ncbi:5'-phosphate synthase pdxT subunit [Dethiosulfatibacter aminovorans DSM 17477]|uniref:Pyridoxal 5'-phosphate synthase subunit PdxT n=1 Tax=Dethiosulfatibacter aminovorans DSM 17477 TaxID=1121476 RepID=A0A1M6MBT1_9FIRM|nr:pyridoxal 5'-phosphate synthase glutaminase subunit PdxT [Dethiosulfatibacter aminovorans]SHJ80978.1 5'-phosphate synthase pdxT subunit [Dethiosulfatibacter aminovorans DSM 17477]
MKKKIGILAVQGAFLEHGNMLERIGVESFEIRKKSDYQGKDFSGLILPGGESTVMGKLLNDLDMFSDLKKMIDSGMPVFGTCAGMIMLAGNIRNENYTHFGSMDINIERNGYGRQLGSFAVEGKFAGMRDVPMTFIRAPYIESTGKDVAVLAETGGRIVAAREKNMLVTSFHPELTDDTRVHEYFLNMI